MGKRSEFLYYAGNNRQHIGKMMPWLKQARTNSTHDLKLLHELKKVTYLSSKEEKYTLYKGQDDVEQMMQNRKARFITPDDALSKNVVNEVYINQLSQQQKTTEAAEESQFQSVMLTTEGPETSQFTVNTVANADKN